MAADPPPPAGVLQWTNRDELMEQNDREVVVQGKLLRVDLSSNKARVHLVFTRPLLQTDARGAVEINGSPPDLSREALRPLVGKTLRVRGTVKVQRVSNKHRPEVLIRERTAIEALD